MLELIAAGGWLMVPIVACSVLALGIVAERFWTLHQPRVLSKDLMPRIWELWKQGSLDDEQVRAIGRESPLGRVLAAGLANRRSGREVVKESIEDTGRHVAHELERFLNALGTVAAITPLLGLLGTVIGMIDVFTAITTAGVGQPEDLAAGISKALITTAAGLSVAIPSLMFHRYFQRRVDELVIEMERESLKLVALLGAGSERR